MNRHYSTPYGLFEWDENKAERNRQKHHVSFEQAAEAFADPDARLSVDIEHSEDEERFQLMGLVG